MVRTRRNQSSERNLAGEAGASSDPLQLILNRLEQQQKTIEEVRTRQTQQDQDRDATIAAAVAAALRNVTQPQPQPETASVPEQAAIPEVATMPQPQVVPQPVVNPDSIQQWMTRFCKHHPPVFDGTFDVQAAEEWINRLEKIFKVLDCPSEKKAQMAIYRLEKDAVL